MLFDKISIRLKLLILSILPLLVLVGVLFYEGKVLYQTQQDSYQVEAIIDLALILDDITTQHALERGLTAGFLASINVTNKHQHKIALLAQYQKSDQADNELKKLMTLHPEDLKNVGTDITQLINLLNQKTIIRSQINQFEQEQKSFSYYTSVNHKTIDTIDRLTAFINDTDLRRELNTLVAMIWLKERAGESRGRLNSVYAKRTATVVDYADIHTYITSFNSTLKLLVNKRNFHTKSDLVNATVMPVFTKINAIQANFLTQSKQLDNIQGPEAEHWFLLATQRISMIKKLINQQASYIENESRRILIQNTRYLVIDSLLMIAAIVVLTSLSYYISLNISLRIGNINALLTRSVNNNDLTIKMNEEGGDEVTQIAKGINRYITWLKKVIKNVEASALEQKYLANHDSLTNIANRNLFFSRLTHLTNQLNRYDRHHAILYIDLDFFKKINDDYGHTVGDKILQQFAKKLVSKIRTVDTAARLGGDEFAIILEEISPEQAQKVSQKLLEEMKEPLLVDHLTIKISLSIGITFFPNDASQDPESLLQQADQALYLAKKSGRQQYRLFDQELRDANEANNQLEVDLTQAIKNQEIFPLFQPQYCLKTQRIIGLEALSRWQHPERGFIPPTVFIPLAEKLSLVNALTESIMTQASKHLLSFIAVDPDLKVAINISGSECSDPHILNLTHKLLAQNKIRPEHIELEITETVLIENPVTSIEVLNKLHDLGVSIAIDDFGTGYSSLSYLTSLPLDILKIDMVFVQGIGIDPQQEIIIQVIIDLSKRLSLKVVAEGIETQEQEDFLLKNGCDYGQGYFYSKPCSAEDIHRRLTLNNLKT